MSEEIQFFPSGSWGMRLEGAQPAGQLGELDYEHRATPEKIEAARELFTEARLADFEAYGSTGRRLRHIESGQVFSVAGDQVLMSRDPRKSGVDCFVVAGDYIWFLRPRGWHGNEELGVPGTILSGRLEAGPGGSVRLVDGKTGSVIQERVRVR